MTHDNHVDRIAIWIIRIFEGVRSIGMTDAECLHRWGDTARELARPLLDSVGAIVHDELERINNPHQE